MATHQSTRLDRMRRRWERVGRLEGTEKGTVIGLLQRETATTTEIHTDAMEATTTEETVVVIETEIGTAESVDGTMKKRTNSGVERGPRRCRKGLRPMLLLLPFSRSLYRSCRTRQNLKSRGLSEDTKKMRTGLTQRAQSAC